MSLLWSVCHLQIINMVNLQEIWCFKNAYFAVHAEEVVLDNVQGRAKTESVPELSLGTRIAGSRLPCQNDCCSLGAAALFPGLCQDCLWNRYTVPIAEQNITAALGYFMCSEPTYLFSTQRELGRVVEKSWEQARTPLPAYCLFPVSPEWKGIASSKL